MEYFIHHILPLKTLKTLGAIYKMYHMLVVPLWLNFYKSPPPKDQNLSSRKHICRLLPYKDQSKMKFFWSGIQKLKFMPCWVALSVHK